MTASEDLRQIANTLILVDPDAYERLHRIADDLGEMAIKVKRGLDEIEPLLKRAIRLSSQEKL